jgi:hypothetical protein
VAELRRSPKYPDAPDQTDYSTFLEFPHTSLRDLGGVRISVKGLLSMIAGAAVSALLFGFQFNSDSNALTSACSILAIVCFNTVFGLNSHLQTRRMLRTKQALEDQNLQIEEQAYQLELSRAAAEEAREAAEAANRAKSASPFRHGCEHP